MKRLWGLCALLVVLWVTDPTATEIVHFDLNQDGAATLVIQEMPDGRKFHILIDAGHASKRVDQGAGKVRAFLNEHGIRELDAMVVTHIDADHAAGVRSLVEELSQPPTRDGATTADARGPPIRIRQLVWPGLIREGSGPRRDRKEFWSAFVERAAALQVPLYTPETGALEQLQPLGIDVQRMAAEKARTSNDTSLVLTVRDLRSNVNYLLTGDMTERSFADLRATLPESVEILHAPHHGADRVVRELIERTKPRYLVISANRRNRFGHPPIQRLRELAQMGRPIDLRARERRRQAAANLVIRSHALDEMIADLKGLQSVDTTADPAIEAAQRTWRDLTPRVAETVINPDTWKNTPPRAAAPSASDSVTALFYDQVLITGERGEISFIDGELTSARLSESDAFLREMMWNELRYTTDAEISGITQWTEMQVYLAAKVADTFAEVLEVIRVRGDSKPLWLTDIERIVARVKGWKAYSRLDMNSALSELCNSTNAVAFGRNRVTAAEWLKIEARLQRSKEGPSVDFVGESALRAKLERSFGSDFDKVVELLRQSSEIAREVRFVQPEQASNEARAEVWRHATESNQSPPGLVPGFESGPRSPTKPPPRKPPVRRGKS